MNAQTETSESGVLDIIKLLSRPACWWAACTATTTTRTTSRLPLRVLMVLGGTGLGIALR